MNMLIPLAFFIMGSLSTSIECNSSIPLSIDKKVYINSVVKEANVDSYSYVKNETADTLHYDGDNSNQSVGLSIAGTFYAGVRFTPSNNDTLRSIIFFHSDKVSQKGTLYIYGTGTDTTPGIKLITQNYITVVDSNWERINLSSPVAVTSGTDFWAVIKITHAAGERPIGVDAGPMVVNRGGFVSTDGASWFQLAVVPLNCNFNIRAILGAPPVVEETEISQGFKISCSTNPIKNNGSIFYMVPNKMNVNIKLYEITGKLAQTLENRVLDKGTYEKTVIVGTTGIYFCCAEAGNYRKVTKMIVVK